MVRLSTESRLAWGGWPRRLLAAAVATVMVTLGLVGTSPVAAAMTRTTYITPVYVYDAPALSSSPDNVASFTRGPPSVPEAVSRGTAASVDGCFAAANTARVLGSSDAYVADAANAVERAIPGRVQGVNSQVQMANGLSREVDVDLGDLIVQVKSGNARGLTGQLQATTATTGRTAIGYAPDIPNAAWEAAARQGVPIARTPDELVAIVKELGG